MSTLGNSRISLIHYPMSREKFDTGSITDKVIP